MPPNLHMLNLIQHFTLEGDSSKGLLWELFTGDLVGEVPVRDVGSFPSHVPVLADGAMSLTDITESIEW